MSAAAVIEDLRLHGLRIATDAPEADGSFAWDTTEMLVVELDAGGSTGLGYTYTQAHAAEVLVRDTLAPLVLGQPVRERAALWLRMNAALRNIGRPGLGTMAVAAVDQALWDLHARLLDVSLADLLGAVREAVPLYGSGGFTSYDDARLAAQLGGWAGEGLRAVKMKVGAEPARDAARVRIAREAVGPGVALMVDANGALDRQQALAAAHDFAEQGVEWFEEPVTSDDPAGLAWLRDRMPAGMRVAAGEYGWDARYFRGMLQAGAVDVLQADATRCGYTGFLQAAALCEAHGIALSAHCAPAVHVPVCAAAPRLAHLEYFHDHVRIESMLLEGVAAPVDGVLCVDRGRPGHGLALRTDAADRYRITP
ncbi:enolase C-terminal domain-like protein [Coralloluteibacterium stylophorae]|uniref:Mandelate racemase n=1 Tax=Coralloluteibacterium stylophorae TaxID=1776034 RepID=A0A8J8AWT9_9GAMM|nr:enolase C-terminal domain-like protein [Coralloluteibacterium stylophorae]MBS7455749.1 mandelate racemase [Coralloluteibacterium stylophorae]